MAGICDRCNERSSQLINIGILPELAPVMHHGYRHVCTDCYDDLVAEAGENPNEPVEPGGDDTVEVSIQARVEGNTSHLEAFSDEVAIEEIGPQTLSFTTARDLDAGAILKISVPSYGLEITAIVEEIFDEDGQNLIDLKLAEQSEGWERLWRDCSSGK